MSTTIDKHEKLTWCGRLKFLEAVLVSYGSTLTKQIEKQIYYANLCYTHLVHPQRWTYHYNVHVMRDMNPLHL